MNRRVAARAIIVHDNKLLCFQLKAYDDKPATDFWSTPGGGVEVGEALVPALKRELLEETAIPAEVGQLLYVQQFEWYGMEQLEFFFHITNAQDYLDIDLSKTTHGTEEIAKFEFINPAEHTVLPKFLSQESFADIGKSAVAPKVFNYL